MENLKNRIKNNPIAFYRLAKIKNKFGYINMGVNYFIYLDINKKGKGLQITVFKQPLKYFDVTIREVKNFTVIYN